MTLQHGSKDEDTRFSVFASLFSKTANPPQQRKEGYLTGFLLPRPSRYFYQFADEVSQETVDLACVFCEPDGVASRVQNHPKMTGDAVRGGGFLNIEKVEIHPESKGKDLGLRFIHEVLVQLRGQWTLAVIAPFPLSNHACEWEANCRLDGDLTTEQLQAAERNNKQVARHFARLGFVQAGTKSDLVGAWFLTASNYFQSANPTASWLSQQQSKNIVIHERPKTVEKTGLDKELNEAAVAFPDRDRDNMRSLVLAGTPAPPPANLAERQAASLLKMEELVRRGASVNNSGSLQIAAANRRDPKLLQALIRLGGDVNYRDELGNSALHVAAACMRHENVEYLCSRGAQTTTPNLDGETPLHCLQNSIQNNADFTSTFGLGSLPVQEVDWMPKLRCLNALLPSEQKSMLKEGWMSPRMAYVLNITAELEMDDIRFTDRAEGISRIDYIPPSVLRNIRGAYNSFGDGWGCCFVAIHAVLQSGRAPTVHRVEQYLEQNAYAGGRIDARKYQLFLGKGGKVEYAIDALINITRNVVMNGDDGWEFEDFRENMERLSMNPLDAAFDVARLKCINHGGGEGTMRGPYNGSSRYCYGEPSDVEGYDSVDQEGGDY